MNANSQINDALQVLAIRLVIPCDIITVHRDHAKVSRSKQFASLRYGTMLLTAAALDGFFSAASGWSSARNGQPLGFRQDRVREAFAEGTGVANVPRHWKVRTRVAPARSGVLHNRSPWEYLSGPDLRDYLDDIHSVRNTLAHGGDPTAISNKARTFYPLKGGGISIRLMSAEGFIQAVEDIASQTAIAVLAGDAEIPEWPHPRSTGASDAGRLPRPYDR